MDTKIVADEKLLAKVRGLTATLYDADGNAVAVVVPPDLYKDLMLNWSNAHFHPEKAEQAWQEYLKNGGRSTAEVMERLKTLGEPKDTRVMNFRLVWPQSVEDELGRVYLRAKEQGFADELTNAVHRLEVQMASDPFGTGESRSGPDRIAIDWRVVIWFRVDEPNHAVVVTGVRYAG